MTIYRIGGESIPQPELSVPYDFTLQLSWSDVEPARHGRAYLLEMDPDFIAPQQLDPSVNLTPQLEELGGRILSLTWTGWGRLSGVTSKCLMEISETAFLGDGDWGETTG